MEEQFEPSNPNFKQRVIDSFDRQPVMRMLGVSMLELRPGEVELQFAHRPDLTQQHGFIHAGIVSTVLDSACGYAAFSLMPETASVLSIEFKVNLLAPAKGQRFRAVGKVRKAGRNITVTEGELYSCDGDEERLTATMVGTMMSVYGRADVEG